MAASDERTAPPLVRRVLSGNEVHEFVHPIDGSTPRERQSCSVSPQSCDPSSAAPPDHLGQFVWQEVSDELSQLPMHLPLLKASCDGSGACCGLHHHVPVTHEERTKIFEVLGSDWESPAPLDVLVHRAYDRGSDDSFNIASIKGTCAFQRGDGLCELHARGGPLAKPMACRSFPSQLVLCGEEWHASLRPECACLQRTAIEGSPLQNDPQSWVSLRSYQRWVASVPEQLCLSSAQQISRDRYLSWLRGLIATLQTSFEPIISVRHAAATLGADVASFRAGDERPPQAWIEEICAWLESWVRSLGGAWSPGSAYVLALHWALRAVRQIAADPSITSPSWSRGRSRDWNRRQASLISLFLHGHGLLEDTQLLRSAQELGHFSWLARAANAVSPVEDESPTLESMTLWMFLWRTLDREPKD